MWQDKGTGFVEGIYDQRQDEAMLLVVPEEEEPAENKENDSSGSSQAPGGFLRADESETPTYLLRSKVSKSGQYSRQQGELKASHSVRFALC